MSVIVQRTINDTSFKRSWDKAHLSEAGCSILFTAVLFIFCCVLTIFTAFKLRTEIVNPDIYIIDTNKLLQNTSDYFLSIALDTALIRRGWIHYNVSSVKLLRLSSHLAPAYLRVGGTSADRLIFDSEVKDAAEYQPLSDGDLDGGACSYSEIDCTEHNISNFTMTGLDWIQLNTFVTAAGFKLLFDLNVLLRNGSQWNSENAERLIQFSHKRKYDVAWQLGNEPNSFRHIFHSTVSPRQLSADFLHLRHILSTFPLYKSTLVVGPDVTRPKFPRAPSLRYLETFLQASNTSVDAVTWHQYYLNGRTATLQDFISPQVMELLQSQVNAVREACHEAGMHTPVWLSETSSAYGGGAPGLSDTFVAGFLWLDKLGLAAREGVELVVRQTLIGGHYGLLDPDTLQPLPDWWLSVLYKKLVGPKVLSVQPLTLHGPPLRLYAHCAPQRGLQGSITLFAINVNPKAVHFVLQEKLQPGAAGLTVFAYIISTVGNLQSRKMYLNGRLLHLHHGDSLPPMEPFRVVDKVLRVPAFSMAFWVFTGRNSSICAT